MQIAWLKLRDFTGSVIKGFQPVVTPNHNHKGLRQRKKSEFLTTVFTQISAVALI